MVVRPSTWLATGLPLTICKMNPQRHRKSGLAALLTNSVSGAGFMDAMGHMLSEDSTVRCDPTAIKQPVPNA